MRGYLYCKINPSVWLASWLRATRFARVSSRSKGDAVLFSYAPVVPSAPSGTLTMLRLASPLFGDLVKNQI